MKPRELVWGALEILLAASMGFAAIVVPAALDPNIEQYDANFLPIVRTAIEGLKLESLPLLFLAGTVVGLVGRLRFWISGAATMLAFPLWSITDILVGTLSGDPGHNLFPIEWAIYTLISLCGVAGAGLARALRELLLSRRSTEH